jgi:NAD-dependent DNA ligase
VGVELEVSKQGKLSPVIKIQPVQVGGVTVENVTGNNARYMIANGIGVGASIEIIRSGDVIPKHVATTVAAPSEQVEAIFEHCPSCGTETKWDENSVYRFCPNENCSGTVMSKITHFFATIGVERIKRATLKKLFDEGFDSVFEMIELHLSMDVSSILGAATGKTFHAQLNSLKGKVPLARFVHALDLADGIIGETIIARLLSHTSTNGYDNLEQLDGIGEAYRDAFLLAMKRLDEYVGISTLRSFFVKEKAVVEVVGDKLAGQKICFTGCRPNEELTAQIVSQGGEIASGVSKKTTLLVVKDLESQVSNKAQAAKKLGIKVIDFGTFKRTM